MEMSNLPADVRLGVVVIGRNEGERLARCLASVRTVPARVYVDSGSEDGSVALALRHGMSVIELDEPPPFTAARARNAGIARLLGNDAGMEFVQVVDGDCEVQEGWLSTALATLRAEPRLALVFGRRRERYPERSIYNALCDEEWNVVPVGDASYVGGDALFRVAALRQVNFYNPAMIAGEDPDLAMRLRKCGWRLRRVDAEMTVHDAAITHFSQWWLRARRAGHAFAELAYLHPDARDPNWRRTVHRILFWGGATPTLLLLSCVLAATVDARWWLAALLLLLLWAGNTLRLIRRERRRGSSARLSRATGVLLMLAKPAQFLGLVGYYRDRLLRRASRLIEYKHGEQP